MPDLSVFQRLVTKAEYDKANEQAALQRQMAQMQMQRQMAGGNDPAAIQIANELAKARAAGDVQRVNDIVQSAKLFDRGIVTDQMGNPIAMGGYGEALGAIAAPRKAMETMAQKQVELGMNPKIEYQKQVANVQGKEIGQRGALLNTQQATLPQLEQTVDQLSNLGKKATYTKAGQLRDAFMRQTGMSMGEGAIARKEYESLVDNQILPLLRQTFGAQFTEREGQSLKKTLGDPDASPEEKDAVLRSFIEQKKRQIESGQREINVNSVIPSMPVQELQGFPQAPAMPPSLPMSKLEQGRQKFNERKAKKTSDPLGIR